MITQLGGHPDIASEILAKAQRVNLLILDVDGVLTDGRLYFDNDGLEYKCFHARDGHGLKLLQNAGIPVAVISGRKSNSVALRMHSLGIRHVYQGHEHKLAAFTELLEMSGVNTEQCAYVGDDLLDLPIMIRVGLAIAVADAHFAVKARAHWCTALSGGQGAVREVCDLLLAAQGHFDKVVADYLQ